MGKYVKLAMAGEGGQGVQSVAAIIADSAYDEGYECLYIPAFGVEQRGGVSIAFVQIADEAIGSPRFKTADIVIALSARAVERTKTYVGRETIFVYDDSIDDIGEHLPKNAAKVLGIPALRIAKEELHPRVFNIIIMGSVIGATGVVSLEQAKKAVEKKLGYKFEQNPKLRELNYKALEIGIEIVKGQV